MRDWNNTQNNKQETKKRLHIDKHRVAWNNAENWKNFLQVYLWPALIYFCTSFHDCVFFVCVCVFMYKSLLKVKNREKLRIAFLILFLPFSRLFLHALYSIFSSFFSPPKHIQTFAIIICIRRVYTRPEHYNIWIQTVNYHPIKLM